MPPSWTPARPSRRYVGCGDIMGIEDTATIGSAATAAARVRELSASQTAPRSRSYIQVAHHSGPAVSSPPTHLGIVDHVVASRQEIVAHVHAAVPAEELARPVPQVQADVYTWFDEHTVMMDARAQRVAEAIMVRQALEAAILAGDLDVVRPYRCQNCRCWSLFWKPALRAAVCLNRRCVDEDDRPSRFTLQQLAEQSVQNFTYRAAT